jgi:uncharacterized protein YciI
VFVFVVISLFLEPVDVIDQHVSEHAAWVEQQYEKGRVLVSGRRKPPVGGIIVLRGDSREEIVELFSEEPFNRRGLVEYQILQFTPGESPRRSPEFDAFAKRAITT